MKTLLAITAVGAALATGAVSAQTITLKVHHFLGPQSIQHTTMLQTWCNNLAKVAFVRLEPEEVKKIVRVLRAAAPPRVGEGGEGGAGDGAGRVADGVGFKHDKDIFAIAEHLGTKL